jgi:hypothetical protein
VSKGPFPQRPISLGSATAEISFHWLLSPLGFYPRSFQDRHRILPGRSGHAVLWPSISFLSQVQIWRQGFRAKQKRHPGKRRRSASGVLACQISLENSECNSCLFETYGASCANRKPKSLGGRPSSTASSKEILASSSVLWTNPRASRSCRTPHAVDHRLSAIRPKISEGICEEASEPRPIQSL